MRIYANQPIGTVSKARQLRREAPKPERRLLRGLREAFPSLKWRHQSPLLPFYADLLCFSEKLVIEVDGDTHVEAEAYDANRTRHIESQGYRIIRVSNNDVMGNLEGVIERISLSFREREGARRVSGGKGEDSPKEMGSAAEATLPSPFRACGAPSLSQKEREL